MRKFGLAALAVMVLGAVPLHAGTVCEMTFTMTGWSAFYKTSSGTGTIRCDNGQTAKVKVSSGSIRFHTRRRGTRRSTCDELA